MRATYLLLELGVYGSALYIRGGGGGEREEGGMRGEGEGVSGFATHLEMGGDAFCAAMTELQCIAKPREPATDEPIALPAVHRPAPPYLHAQTPATQQAPHNGQAQSSPGARCGCRLGRLPPVLGACGSPPSPRSASRRQVLSSTHRAPDCGGENPPPCRRHQRSVLVRKTEGRARRHVRGVCLCVCVCVCVCGKAGGRMGYSYMRPTTPCPDPHRARRARGTGRGEEQVLLLLASFSSSFSSSSHQPAPRPHSWPHAPAGRLLSFSGVASAIVRRAGFNNRENETFIHSFIQLRCRAWSSAPAAGLRALSAYDQELRCISSATLSIKTRAAAPSPSPRPSATSLFNVVGKKGGS